MPGFDLNALFQQAQQLQEQMREAQDRLAQKIVTGSSGGGMVIVTANGKGEIQKVQIDKQAVDPRDVAMLEDLVTSAVNAAVACRSLGVALVHYSTNFVFDGRLDRPYLESDLVGPLGAYAQSKADGERRVLAEHPAALVIRTAALFGDTGSRAKGGADRPRRPRRQAAGCGR